ncbi:MAG: sigma-70 family RNA polymerase sigma factor [Acidimicrobiales bacterium]
MVREARRGDAGALDELLRQHYSRVYALCRRMMGNDADAADAAQDALIAIARGLAADRFDGRSRFSTWAHRVTTNACLDELRRRRRRPDALAELDHDGAASAPSGRPALEDDVADRIDIDRALSRLPVDFRAAVVLRDLCGLDYASIAEALDVPPGTVRSRIARGRSALAELLGNSTPPPRRPTSTP